MNSGSNWLCASGSGNVLTVSAGTSCPGYNSSLATGTYSGTVIFTGAGATNTGQLTVTLTVSNVGMGTNGLVATPSTLAFNVAAGSGVTTQTPTITLNGVPEQISGVSWSTVSGQSWLSASTPFTGSVTVSVNTAFLSLASDSGTVLVTTPVGQISIPVSVSTNGGSSFGLFASPAALSFNVAFGAGPTQQTISVLQNGSPATITGLSENTSTGVNWFQPFISGSTGQVTVQVNPSSPSALQSGSYTGTLFVSTSFGQVSVPVTLNVGTGTSGLSSSVNPVYFSLPAGSGTATQYVNINLNGQPVTLTGVSSATSTGQAWLTASISGSTGQVAVTVNPVSLFSGGIYNGTVFVSTTVGSVAFGVTLNLGSGTSGLVASPSAVNFNIPILGSGVAPQNVGVTLNGLSEPIQSVTYVLNSGQNWLLVSNTGTGIMTVAINGAAFTTSGTYTATVTVNTSFGTVTIPVSATAGSGAQPISVSPVSGSAGRQVFSFVAQNTLGVNSIQYTQFLFSRSGINALNACYISYDPIGNVFYLLSDDTTQWYGLLGDTANNIGNAQCTIYGATSGSTRSGTDLTVNVDVGFRSGFAGLKNIYQFTGDTLGDVSGWRPMGTWSDTGDANVVEIVSLMPNFGSGPSQTFTAVVQDGSGGNTISFAQLVMNAGLSGYNACFIHYDRASNVFYLLNDSGTGWFGLISGSATQVQNSQCILQGVGSGGTVAGSNLTITYKLTFTGGFTGAKRIYMQAVDQAGIIEVWHQTAIWTP